MKKIRLRSSKDRYFKDFWKIYESSFPLPERRFLKEQEKIFKDESYFAHVLLLDEVVGIFCYWDMGEFCFFEHFAIKEDFRGLGLGKKVFEYFIQDKENIVLEIEKIEDEIAKKRYDFYQKFGFIKNRHKHYQVEFRENGERLELLLLSQKKFTCKKYEEVYQKMRDKLTGCWI